jgi:hypothetical protein
MTLSAMTGYWESRFKNEGAMWKSEPSDSAVIALGLFKYELCIDTFIKQTGAS